MYSHKEKKEKLQSVVGIEPARTVNLLQKKKEKKAKGGVWTRAATKKK